MSWRGSLPQRVFLQPSKLHSRFDLPMGGTSSQTKPNPPQPRMQRRERDEAESRGGSTSKRTSSQAEEDSLESELQDQVRDTPDSGGCCPANGASGQTEAGSLESQLQMLRGSLHPLASEFLKAQEVVVGIAAQLLADNQPLRSSLPAARPSLLEANQQIRQQLREEKELVAHLRERNRQLQSSQEDEMARRLGENGQLQRELVEQKEKVARLLKEKQQVQEKLKDQEKLVSEVLERNGELQRKLEEKGSRVSHLVQENDRLRQENPRLRRGPGSQRWTPSFWSSSPALTAFPVQVWTTGQTGGCERDIVNDVSKFLAGVGISLQQEGYEMESDRFLLLFCPVFSRVGSDTVCALEALNRVRKAVLVVLHHKAKGSTQEILETQRQVQHEALVQTVHACYSMQDGFYPCDMNDAAVASVAKAIQEQRRS